MMSNNTSSANQQQPRLTPISLQHLMDHGYTVVPDFLSKPLVQNLLNDLLQLREKGHFQVATIGSDDNNSAATPFSDIRRSETCFIGRNPETDENQQSKPSKIPNEKGREDLYPILDNLRTDLSVPFLKYGTHTADIGPLDPELEEVMYAYYPAGGYYHRHVDAEADSMSRWRKYSFLLYLQPQDSSWSPTNGGQLRIHRDGGKDHLPAGALPNFVDIDPVSGTLILFRSDLWPHEVLPTRVERFAIVGWFLSKSDIAASTTTVTVSSSSTTLLHPTVLEALRTLRDATPGMRTKLERPVSQNTAMEHTSGLLMGDAFEPTPPSTTVQQEEPAVDDTDPTYWKSIAAFDQHGTIQTLSLGGQHLRKIDPSVMLHAAFTNIVTLDLGNTDLAIETLVSMLNQQSRLRQLHLGGNALGCRGMKQVLDETQLKVWTRLETLDVRYNDIAAEGAQAIANLLQGNSESMALDKLYLEGNNLGDDGAVAISLTGSLRELYLGQNGIGPAGAAALAKALPAGRLVSLYLEGNSIGPEGAIAFRTVLERLGKDSTLRKLYSDNNNIGKEESIRLGKSLQSDTIIGDAAFFSDE